MFLYSSKFIGITIIIIIIIMIIIIIIIIIILMIITLLYHTYIYIYPLSLSLFSNTFEAAKSQHSEDPQSPARRTSSGRRRAKSSKVLLLMAEIRRSPPGMVLKPVNNGINYLSTRHTLPETNSLHLKNGGWKMNFLLGNPIFSCYVSFRIREGTKT